MNTNDTETKIRPRHPAIIYEVQCFEQRYESNGCNRKASISYLMPKEARDRLRKTTQSSYWSQVALGFPHLSAPAPFVLICFDTAAYRYARFEAARQRPGLGRAQFGLYPYQIEDAPGPDGYGPAPAIGLVDFMTLDALRRAQELLPDFTSINTSMLNADTHYLIFLDGRCEAEALSDAEPQRLRPPGYRLQATSKEEN